MIRRDHPRLSLSRQCRLLRVSRSSLYQRPKGESAENLALMRRIDELFLNYPFYGSRQMVRHLWREGVGVGRHRVRRLMRLMGLQAIYQAPRTSRPHPEHRVYPYLLKGLAIERPHQVWSADITYIPVQKGFLYLVAVMDWATRRVLSFRLSNTLDARFCTEALTEALERYGRPEIFNSDQGSQFTSLEFTSVLKDSGVAISMDGRGRCMDNIFIERLWRSLKYEAVYLHEISDGFAAQRLISRWFAFYDKGRPHSALGGSTPAEAYEEGMLTQRPAQRRSSPAPLPALPEQQDVLNRTLAA
jgi:putative transposase